MVADDETPAERYKRQLSELQFQLRLLSLDLIEAVERYEKRNQAYRQAQEKVEKAKEAYRKAQEKVEKHERRLHALQEFIAAAKKPEDVEALREAERNLLSVYGKDGLRKLFNDTNSATIGALLQRLD